MPRRQGQKEREVAPGPREELSARMDSLEARLRSALFDPSGSGLPGDGGQTVIRGLVLRAEDALARGDLAESWAKLDHAHRMWKEV